MPKKDRKKNLCTEEDKVWNGRIARYRIVMEHAIVQLTRFTLRQVYRGWRMRHAQVVRVAAAMLVNRRTRFTPLKRSGTAA